MSGISVVGFAIKNGARPGSLPKIRWSWTTHRAVSNRIESYENRTTTRPVDKRSFCRMPVVPFGGGFSCFPSCSSHLRLPGGSRIFDWWCAMWGPNLHRPG
jgi:hypothetical protein